MGIREQLEAGLSPWVGLGLAIPEALRGMPVPGVLGPARRLGAFRRLAGGGSTGDTDLQGGIVRFSLTYNRLV